MAILLSLILTAGLMEICLRIFGPPYYRFNNLSQEYFSNPRGYHDVIRREGKHTIYGLPYHEDEYGYRISPGDDQTPIEAPENQVLGLGDSFTYGRGVRYEDIYLTRLEELLSQGRNRVAIKNCGVVGAGVEDIAEIYARESDSLPRGSLVIYGLVLNDFGLDLTEPIKGLNFIDINNGGYAFSPLRKYSAFINFIFHSIETRRLHTKTLRAYLESFDGENGQRGFDLLEQLNQSVLEEDGTLLVVTFPLLYDFEEYPFLPMHQKVTSFCDRSNILCLDLLPAFSRRQAEDLWSNPTDHHPNDIAHEIAAAEIAACVEGHVSGF
jgi:hypothetical protein